MAYCFVSDILGRIDDAELMRLTDDDGMGSADTAKIQEAIDDAQAEIDSYCAKLYSVPFSDPVPAMIVKICKDIAVYNVYSLKNAADDDVESRYNRALKFLLSISKGLVKIGAGEPSTVSDGGPESLKPASDKTFSLKSMEGF